MSNIANLSTATIFNMAGTTYFQILAEAAGRWYSMPKRKYHNKAHSLRVASSVGNMLMASDKCGDWFPSLIMAALWHDAVYVPGAKNGINEQASAAALQHEANIKIWIDKADAEHLEVAKELIVGTDVASHMRESTKNGRNSMHGYMLDADLSQMADPYRLFAANQVRITQEVMGNVYPEMDGSCNWLRNLVESRPFIFRTDIGRELYETTARYNISRFIHENASR